MKKLSFIYLKKGFSKILLIIVITGFFSSCNSVKRVSENEQLLEENTIYVNDKKDNSETLNSLLQQRKNKKVAGIPLRLHIYNLARPNIDSIVNSKLDENSKRKARLERFLSKKQFDRYIDSRKNFNKWLKKTGEAPVIIDKAKTKKSLKNLYDYYYRNGWFDVDTSYVTTYLGNKKAKIDYYVRTGEPFIIDSISSRISSPIIDSIYQKKKR